MFDNCHCIGAPGQKKKITVEETLSEKQFAKIYLIVGINEMGTAGTVESFMKALWGSGSAFAGIAAGCGDLSAEAIMKMARRNARTKLLYCP